MKDTIVTGTLSGIVGSLVMDALTYIVRILGVKTSTPWDVATVLFLHPRFLGTVSGLIIGFAGSLALGIAAGLFTAVIIRLTGRDYAWLKGILAAESLGFAGLGFFAPILGVAGFLKHEPATNIFAFLALLMFGGTVGLIISKYGLRAARKTSAS